jgi:hypothetical protein
MARTLDELPSIKSIYINPIKMGSSSWFCNILGCCIHMMMPLHFGECFRRRGRQLQSTWRLTWGDGSYQYFWVCLHSPNIFPCIHIIIYIVFCIFLFGKNMFTNNQTTYANVNLQAHTHRRTQIHTSASFSENMQVYANIHIDNENDEVQPYI